MLDLTNYKRYSWDKLMEDFKVGVAYLGSEKLEYIQEEQLQKCREYDHYADRKYNRGSKNICLDKLSKYGNVLGETYLTRVGKVFIKDKIIIIVDSVSDYVIIYKKLSKINYLQL